MRLESPVALDPVKQGLGHTANLGRNRFNICPQGRILASVFLHQPHRTLSDFGGKFVCLVHGSILSKVGAFSKPRAIHTVQCQARCIAERTDDQSRRGGGWLAPQAADKHYTVTRLIITGWLVMIGPGSRPGKSRVKLSGVRKNSAKDPLSMREAQSIHEV